MVIYSKPRELLRIVPGLPELEEDPTLLLIIVLMLPGAVGFFIIFRVILFPLHPIPNYLKNCFDAVRNGVWSGVQKR